MPNNKFTESELENAIIELFPQEGYTHVYGDSIHRKYDEILLEDDIKEYLLKNYANAALTEAETAKIINHIKLVPAYPLYDGNKTAFRLVNEGFDIKRDDPKKQNIHINLIDFDNPQNNNFKVINQFSVQGERLRRPGKWRHLCYYNTKVL